MLTRYCRVLGAAVAVAGSLVCGAPARAVTYSFDTYLYSSNDFTVTSDGQTATFSSASGPATFTVNQSSDTFTFPVALGGFGNLTGDPLTITFSDPSMGRIMIPFGIFAAFAIAPATLVVTPDTGVPVLYTTTSYNSVTGSPEGEVDFVPTGLIRSLTLQSGNAFAIASVDVADPSVSVPDPSVTVSEPISAALLVGGLMMLALTRRRRD